MSGISGGVGRGHTHTIGAATTNATVLATTAAVAGPVGMRDWQVAASCGAVGCNSNHPGTDNGAVGVIDIGAGTPSRITAVTAIPSVTGPVS